MKMKKVGITLLLLFTVSRVLCQVDNTVDPPSTPISSLDHSENPSSDLLQYQWAEGPPEQTGDSSFDVTLDQSWDRDEDEDEDQFQEGTWSEYHNQSRAESPEEWWGLSSGELTVHVRVTEDSGEEEEFDMFAPVKSRTELYESHGGAELIREEKQEVLRRARRGFSSKKKKKKKFDECKKEHQKARATQPQIAKIVDMGEQVELPCRYCDDPRQKFESAHLWMVFRHETGKDKTVNMWTAAELPLDTHDKRSKNRVFVKSDHTLIIDKVKMTDRGTYFCVTYNAKEKQSNKYAFVSSHMNAVSAVAMAEDWKNHGRKQHNIDFLYHLDIGIPMRAILVSAFDFTFPKPEKDAVQNIKEKWESFTEWTAWTPCNRCDIGGERRRAGHCKVRPMGKWQDVGEPYLRSVFQLYRTAPCHSTIFVHMTGHQIVNRRHYVEIGRCKIKCAEQKKQLKRTKSARSNLGFFDRIQLSVGIKKPKVKKYKMKLKMWHTANLTCPGATQMSAVVWKKGFTMLPATSILPPADRRYSIDVMNVLHLLRLRLEDAGKYTCYYDTFQRAEYKVKVLPALVPVDLTPYFRYLYMAYMIDAVIFVAFMAVKCLQRHRTTKRKRPKRYSKKSSSESRSSSNSLSTATPHTQSSLGDRSRAGTSSGSRSLQTSVDHLSGISLGSTQTLQYQRTVNKITSSARSLPVTLSESRSFRNSLATTLTTDESSGSTSRDHSRTKYGSGHINASRIATT